MLNFPHHLITFSVVWLHYIALPWMAILQFANSSFVREPKSTQKTQGTDPNFFWFFVPKHCFVLCRTFQCSHCCFSGWTPLHWSAANGRLETCKVLVSSKADLAARDRCGRCRCCSRFSLNQSHPLACSRGRTALKRAMDEKKSDVVSFLRSVGAPQWFRSAISYKIAIAKCSLHQ